MKHFIVILFVGFLVAHPSRGQTLYPFLNTDLPINQRVDDLIGRLTLEEKIGQLLYNAPAIDKLDIPEYNWWNECLHGVARAGRATVFPQAIGMAATWDTDLMFRVGDAISTEARAKFNAFTKAGLRGQYMGLTFWTPNVNIFRDPRWGRGQETYGEDPYLTARIGVAFVKGLQGDHPTYLKAAGMAKHFAVHNGPEGMRHEFNAVVSQKDLWETYLPAFEALVTEAKVEGVMGAYNRTNGDPCCAHPYLMQDVLRKQWKFDGYYVSDCWALHDFYNGHNVSDSPAGAAALAINTGCNLNCGDTYHHLAESIASGLTTEEVLDDNLRSLLPTRFRLGLFDPSGKNPYATIGPEVIRSIAHQQLALEAATKSIVLLKNKNNLLPLAKEVPTIYVTGPTAAHIQALLGNYYGLSENLSTLLEGITGKVSPQTSVRYSQGALLDEANRNPVDWFSGTAGEAEVTIACLGISQLIEGEEGESIMSRHKGDRQRIRLPQNQIDFLKKIRANAQKLVVIITGGSAISIPEIYEMADAVICTWYPGERGGEAIGDILFGDAIPSGRLPVTVVQSINDLPPYDDYTMANRTYRYLNTTPQFPFGFGLSYTTFEYSDIRLNTTQIQKGESVKASFTLTNTGTYDAEEVVQLYIANQNRPNQPKRSLKGFKRIHLAAGETKEVTFTVSPNMMTIVDAKGNRA
ncbi:MAG: glycoside hydrolase family 3 C-terminal domain-containing protein, partial [Saprospiraceae bacterium]|nr:glycoside hydrolase family 3 C-terminal domain-containing protein [Saprospiraceae bacterium]